MTSRKCYLLTCDENSARAQFSKNVLKKVGFEVIFFHAIPNDDKVLSNKESMICIYNIIANTTNTENNWTYVFEDDINVIEDIYLDEIIKYENISNFFFYLGLCNYGSAKNQLHELKINNNNVTIVNGNIRGLHAIGLSKIGASELLKFCKQSTENYMDIILEQFSMKHPANVVRYDLESYIHNHKGIFYQDRNRFPSTI